MNVANDHCFAIITQVMYVFYSLVFRFYYQHYYLKLYFFYILHHLKKKFILFYNHNNTYHLITSWKPFMHIILSRLIKKVKGNGCLKIPAQRTTSKCPRDRRQFISSSTRQSGCTRSRTSRRPSISTYITSTVELLGMFHNIAFP